MTTSPRNKGRFEISGACRSSIAAGDGLPRRLSVIRPSSNHYVAMVRAGEASGKLDAVLQAIVADRHARTPWRSHQPAIRYPFFLFGSAVGLILFFFLLYGVGVGRSSARYSAISAAN